MLNGVLVQDRDLKTETRDDLKQVSEKAGARNSSGLQRKNDEAEIEMMTEGLEKKLRQIDNEYQARKDEIARQEAGWKRDNAKRGESGSVCRKISSPK